MAAEAGPGETGGPGHKSHDVDRDGDLDRRRRELGATLATRLPDRSGQDASDGRAAATGYGQAMKLSSEFIAAIAVGVGLGWGIDRLAGISPWGLIVFLLLGFCAGILNVLRSVGKVAEFGQGSGPDRRK